MLATALGGSCGMEHMRMDSPWSPEPPRNHIYNDKYETDLGVVFVLNFICFRVLDYECARLFLV